MWLKNDVVDVVGLLVLVVDVELVVVVLVLPVGAVVVVVLEVAGGVTEVDLVSPVVAVTTCCWTNGSLLWKLE
jgi:hypothetical protein